VKQQGGEDDVLQKLYEIQNRENDEVKKGI
jgi:hypothetical protein